MPSQVAAASGLDVLSHAIESYTAIHFDERPKPDRPILRPAYQGSNPISDLWSLEALRMVAEYLPRAVEDPGDDVARSQMILASAYAGIGFGNAGVHLPHGMSYPVSGMVRTYRPSGYDVGSRAGAAWDVGDPQRSCGLPIYGDQLHRNAIYARLRFLGANISRASADDAGKILE